MSNSDGDSSSRQANKELDQPLFRKQVLDEQRNQWLGKVLIAPSLTLAFFSLFAFISACAILSLLFFADYTRKERVTGWLVPEQGMLQVISPMSGRATELNVKDGDFVNAGELILTVSAELNTEARGATQQQVVQRLQRRKDSLVNEQEVLVSLFKEQVRSLQERMAAVSEEQLLRTDELEIQKQRIELAEGISDRFARGRVNGAVSESNWLDVENDRLEQFMRYGELQRNRSLVQRELVSMQTELRQLPLKHRIELAENSRAIDALEQALAEAESRREIVLTAPESGTVSALQLERGNSVNANVSLLNIIPEGSTLEAQLYLPTHAIGFIRVGQPVLLRYKAFPYQKFGHYEGEISEVARSTVNRQSITRQQPGAGAGASANEPVYPVKVRLLSQTVDAYGSSVDLQPGMELEADVLIETRRLIEWVLEPLYTLTGKIIE
ncbi:MAG: HlyD family secretion protein [Granulosicoccus sp.]